MGTPFVFTLPPELSAKEPPERRGIRRDQVRLLVIERATGKIEHTRFDKIDSYLRQKDLLVFNSSRTLPASLRGCECGATHGPCMEVRLAEHLPDDSWLALLLCEQGEPFGCGLRAGMKIDFTKSLNATVLERDANIPRLWKLRFSISGTELVDLIYRLGKPIRYEYVSAPWDLDYYQTVYATEPGSAEMPSAGRAFTWKLLLDLRRRGIERLYRSARRSLKLSGRRTRSSVSGVGGGIFCESNHRSKNQSGTGQRRSCHRRRHNCRARAGIGRERKRQHNRGPRLHPFEDRSSASIAVRGRIAHRFARAGGEPSRFAQRIFANGTNSRCLSRSDREKISLAR